MAPNIILVCDSANIAVPLGRFIACWVALHDYGTLANCEDSATAWRSSSLAWRMNDNAPVPTNLHSIELLCRLASNAANWSIALDPAFRQRNQQWLTGSSHGGAMLSPAALAEWDARSPQQQRALTDEADGNVFALVVAHGSDTE